MVDNFGPEQRDIAERTAKVQRRVAELRQRRAELAAGERPSPESATLARQRAEESLRRAERAHSSAAQRHEESARIHERTANALQSAAMQGADGSPQVLQKKADEHWQAAHDSHLQTLEHEAMAQDPKKSSSG
jgi:glycerophosphoryl diester phosphodiesterase